MVSEGNSSHPYNHSALFRPSQRGTIEPLTPVLPHARNFEASHSEAIGVIGGTGRVCGGACPESHHLPLHKPSGLQAFYRAITLMVYPSASLGCRFKTLLATWLWPVVLLAALHRGGGSALKKSTSNWPYLDMLHQKNVACACACACVCVWVCVWVCVGVCVCACACVCVCLCACVSQKQAAASPSAEHR